MISSSFLVLGPLLWAVAKAATPDNIPAYAIPPNYSPSLARTVDFHPLSPSSLTSSSFSFPSQSGRVRRKRSEDDGTSDDGARGWKSAEELVNTVDISDAKINASMEQSQKDDNITIEIKPDESIYYEHEKADFRSHWVDLDELESLEVGSVQEHPMLSKSYRRADTIELKFHFPFYGHNVQNITIATGGFLYTGKYVHSWLAATQYIAPLMANFDTSLDEVAKIRYADNGTALIVEWTNVHLKGQLDNKTEGNFTFQVILHNTGDIVFAYKSVPLLISKIKDEEHPVRIGLSDAYIIDRTIFFVRRKTIYEYHRLSVESENVANETAIYFRALPTCNRMDTCSSCLKTQEKLKCQWCPSLNMCSDGVDRNRQNWLKGNCDDHKLSHGDNCDNIINGKSHNFDDNSDRDNNQNFNDNTNLVTESSQQLAEEESHLPHKAHLGIATLAIIVFLIASVFAWFGYAYFFPHTWSGQVLIKYRPSRWHWLRSEPRYTAASIHM